MTSKTKAAPAPQAPRPILRQPSVLVLTEKHGSAYFLVRDDAELAKVCLSILKGRLKDGYWYGSIDELRKPDPPEFTRESIATLPASLQPAAQKKWNQYALELRGYNLDVEEHQDMARAIAEKNGISAYRILMNRSGHEYERVSVERLQQTYGEKYS